jgi:hypothetical protein
MIISSKLLSQGGVSDEVMVFWLASPEEQLERCVKVVRSVEKDECDQLGMLECYYPAASIALVLYCKAGLYTDTECQMRAAMEVVLTPSLALVDGGEGRKCASPCRLRASTNIGHPQPARWLYGHRLTA